MTREELVTVYQDTKGKGTMFRTPYSQKIFSLTADCSISKKEGNLIVEPMDTVSAIIKYIQTGKTTILNMASAKHKGGGVERGAMAQEECLFRCSNLFTIPDEYYPMSQEQFIYTHGATFFKDVNYSTIWPMEVDVITIAAPNLNKDHKGNEISKEITDNYEAIMLEKMRSMIAIAILNGTSNLILGAWGCGAFKNDPKIVSRLFKEALKDKRYAFDNVVFAIINDRNSVGDNFQIFLETLTT